MPTSRKITPEYRYDSFLANDIHGVEMNKDGSSTPINYDFQVPSGKSARLERLLGSIMDTTISNDKFGAVDLSLGTGLEIKIFESDGTTEVYDLLDGEPIKTIADWACHVGVDAPVSRANDMVPIRWSFYKAGAPIVLDNQRIFRAIVNDDLTGLVMFRLHLQGWVL